MLLGAAAVLLFVLPCLYVASIGPVVRYLDGPRTGAMWMVIYAPLEWAHEHTPLRRPLELYVGLWVDLGVGPGD